METSAQSTNYWLLAVFILPIVAAASTGALFKPGPWYEALAKPAWTPPNWLFPLVWMTLYICIVTAGWFVWQETGSWLAAPLLFWFAQVVFNAAWSWLFFGMHSPLLALADLLFMLACIIGFIVAAYPVSETAALLFVPYAVWVCIAGMLNLTIWRLNDWPQAATTG